MDLVLHQKDGRQVHKGDISCKTNSSKLMSCLSYGFFVVFLQALKQLVSITGEQCPRASQSECVLYGYTHKPCDNLFY